MRTTLRLALILLLLLLTAAGWHWRREIRAMWEFWRGGHTEILPATGITSPKALAQARDRIDSLNGWRADSVVLGASEFGALLLDGMPAEVRGRLDSTALTLGDRRIELTGRLQTGLIPRAALGPLAGLLRPWERVRAGGKLEVLGPGHAVWLLDGLAIRGVRIPEGMIGRLVQGSLGGSVDGAVPFALPAGVRDLRVRPGGVAIYGGAR